MLPSMNISPNDAVVVAEVFSLENPPPPSEASVAVGRGVLREYIGDIE
jgi:hypothetical protein